MSDRAPSDFDAQAASWDADPGKTRRARDVAAALRTAVPLCPTTRALEYGAGTGLLSFELKDELGSIVLADSSQGMLAVTGEKIETAAARHMQTLLMDLTADPLPPRSFDLVYSMMTLHHIADTPAILRTFAEMLVPGGWLAIADLDAEDGSFHGPGMDVHHGFDRAALAEQLAAADFENVAIDTCHEMRRHERTYSVFLAVGSKAS